MGRTRKAEIETYKVRSDRRMRSRRGRYSRFDTNGGDTISNDQKLKTCTNLTVDRLLYAALNINKIRHC